ncbi:type II toxin-antitoxin system VapC family toxin [Rhodospirillum rubrum]|uniref:PIN domain-containing protein n=1 Tax=Rhodospirillum rubrum (strain ATCC 11170 / ATH 1.1.1 / DSM 467 / LMG 4362 / NCIMB 8255 / S1) TaxID=269796 RepID=Q2RQ50_RHORT|nr:hypothetical protein [Rhodospirillum rubrum]ABC23745.1 hypothetical protein Rru_A2948 [Rhodospirillum rubrum ATCC 11170]AEO49484.1 hypothetical protein F11_15110 [Rhodospirillum rubrum F11]MBK5955425.1 hypothetical protein [Rhodospirillum rubrum]QXG79699.1 hypothetical protein KUL73_15205 [Rhodospirillum rubrum]HAQ00755.1 hypothetical protein [Rhodospirillum rubrum]
MKADLARALRRLRPDRITTAPTRRADADLPFVDDRAAVGGPLVLDTCVYIDVLEGKSPPLVDDLLQRRPIFHLAVILGELCHAFGRLSPGHPGTAAILAVLRDTIEDIPRHRVAAPSVGVMMEAGILAGLLFRLGSLPKGREGAAFNDAVLFLHALEKGQTVLTRNLQDFDLMAQIAPAGRVLFYRAVS